MNKIKIKPVIIIADDEDDIRDTYELAFAYKGFTVLTARDGLEVLDLLEKQNGKVGIILSDIVMPGMDGFEVLEKIKKHELYKKIPVVVASNLENETDRKEAMRLGAFDFFEKVKWTPMKLAEKIREMCFWEEEKTESKKPAKKNALKKNVAKKIKAVKELKKRSPKKIEKKAVKNKVAKKKR